MAWESLTDFFALHHNCNDWTLQKAVMHCASRAGNPWQNDPGVKRETLHKAAHEWRPEIYFHKTLKRIMVAAGNASAIDPSVPMPEPLTKRQITPSVTRVRKELETWLREHYPLTEERTHG